MVILAEFESSLPIGTICLQCINLLLFMRWKIEGGQCLFILLSPDLDQMFPGTF